ncbi:MAG: ribosome biogenesis GTPase YlqF, partial [Rugosibacter sp.]|nr:ribosome biogenesis GTPase YlqF [Rugosibacter sp.]
GVGVLEAVAKKRGCVQQRRGKELDLEKAAMIFLTDFRAGKLGRITLETPASRAAMLAGQTAPATSPG